METENAFRRSCAAVVTNRDVHAIVARDNLTERGNRRVARDKMPVTPAIRALRLAGAVYEHHLYNYQEKGGTAVSSRELGVPEHAVIKTLVMVGDSRSPLIVLMHGDCTVSTRELARQAGMKQISPCLPETAARHTGYLVGGTSPFGTRITLPVFMEESIASLERLYINGGKRGFLVSMTPAELMRILNPTMVNVAIP